MSKLSQPMQDVLTVIGFYREGRAQQLPDWVKSNTTKALIGRGLIEHRFTDDGEVWVLTDVGRDEVALINVEADVRIATQVRQGIVDAVVEVTGARVPEGMTRDQLAVIVSDVLPDTAGKLLAPFMPPASVALKRRKPSLRGQRRRRGR